MSSWLLSGSEIQRPIAYLIGLTQGRTAVLHERARAPLRQRASKNTTPAERVLSSTHAPFEMIAEVVEAVSGQSREAAHGQSIRIALVGNPRAPA